MLKLNGILLFSTCFIPLSFPLPLFSGLLQNMSSQRESSCTLGYTANQSWCQDVGFIPAITGLWCSAVEFLIVIGCLSAFLPAVTLMWIAVVFLFCCLCPSASFLFSSLFSKPLENISLSFSSPGCRKSTDRLSVGQLWRHAGTDHWRLSERLA